MNVSAKQLAGSLAWLLCTAALPALAGGLSASSAVGGSSASVAGSSASSTSSERSSDRSSDSSSRSHQVAAGPYRIVEVAQLVDRPGTVRLRLQAQVETQAAAELWLDLPQPTFEQAHLGTGDAVAVRRRPYGVEFARADTQQAFFLLLDDDWYRELASNPVTL